MGTYIVERTALRGGGSIAVRVIEERGDSGTVRGKDEPRDPQLNSVFKLGSGTILDKLGGDRLQDPRNGENYVLVPEVSP